MQETPVWFLGGKFPWRRDRLPTPVLWPGESLWTEEPGGYSPWSSKESNMTERLSTANRHLKLIQHCKLTISSVPSSNSVISNSLWPHGLQHTRLLCPHQLPEIAQTRVLPVGGVILPSHPLSTPSPPAFNHSQHQGLFQWVSSSHQVVKVLQVQVQHQSFHEINCSPIIFFFKLRGVRGTNEYV